MPPPIQNFDRDDQQNINSSIYNKYYASSPKNVLSPNNKTTNLSIYSPSTVCGPSFSSSLPSNGLWMNFSDFEKFAYDIGLSERGLMSVAQIAEAYLGAAANIGISKHNYNIINQEYQNHINNNIDNNENSTTNNYINNINKKLSSGFDSNNGTGMS